MPDIKELVQEIKTMGEGKVSVDTFTTKIEELKTQIDKRNNTMKEIQEKNTQMETDLKKQSEDFANKLTDAVKEMGNSFIKNSGSNNKDVPDEKIYGKSFGEFCSKIKFNSQEFKTLSENTGSLGGYLVPDTWSREILKKSIEGSVVRAVGARKIDMPSPQFSIPAIKSTNNSGSVYGGIITYWGEESSNLEDGKTNPTFQKINLNAQKLFGYTESYEDLNMDSIIAMGPLLMELFSDAIAFEEDCKFLTGDGVNKPLGVTNAPCRVTVSRSTASQIHTDDVVNMLARFSGKLDKAVWICNQTTLPYLLKLQDAAGNYIWFPGMSGSIASQSPGRLYGLPLIISEKVSTLGTEGDLMLTDFSNYIIGDLHGLRIEESMHFKFGTDKRVWRIIKRVDGKPWLKEQITPKNGDALSPFVLIG